MLTCNICILLSFTKLTAVFETAVANSPMATKTFRWPLHASKLVASFGKICYVYGTDRLAVSGEANCTRVAN